MGRVMNEHDSKRLVSEHGVPVVQDRLVRDATAAARAAEELGYPVVVKLCGERIAHKTERGLVRLALTARADVERAATELLAAAVPGDGDVALLVAPMVKGSRELIAGVHRDPQFGPCVMLGLGGVLAEATADVVFRLVPLELVDAEEMIEDLAAQPLLGAVRGEPEVDRAALTAALLGLSDLAQRRPDVRSVDVNPLVVSGGLPVAVDALVEVDSGG
jgi:acetyl-CoA synthetase (ADP-forming)